MDRQYSKNKKSYILSYTALWNNQQQKLVISYTWCPSTVIWQSLPQQCEKSTVSRPYYREMTLDVHVLHWKCYWAGQATRKLTIFSQPSTAPMYGQQCDDHRSFKHPKHRTHTIFSIHFAQSFSRTVCFRVCFQHNYLLFYVL